MEAYTEHDPLSPSKSTSKKTKKRKREKQHKEAGVEEPAELQETVETVKAKVQVIPDDPNKIAPIVSYFSSGYDPCKNRNNPPSVKVFRNKSERKASRLQVVVKPSDSNVEFAGTNYSGEAAAAQLCRYSLGVLDKETQTLKIIPIAANKIFRLEPKVRTSDCSDKKASSSAKSELSRADKEEKMNELTSLYGSKKSIKQDKVRKELNKEVDPASQKILEERIKEVSIDNVALESTSAHVARNIPPHDLSATTPQEAYPLDKIILRGEWEFLEDIYKLLQEGAEVSTDTYPTFVSNRLHKLQDIQDEVEQKTLCSVFSFINHLIKFSDQFSMDRFSSAKHHKIPPILRRKFTTLFADSESKRLTADQINLLTSYVLVLTLHADGFRTDPSDIAKDLRTSPVDLRRHFENLGCKFSREKGTLLATLPVPIQFPIAEKRRRRR
ncbi:hypothetical protein SLE2022_225130 [Rubroshorea leprosula]